MNNIQVVFWGLLIISLSTQQCTGSPEAKKLHETILKNYNKLVRPIKSASENVTVKFGITLMKLVELNEKNHLLRSLIWLTLVWDDYYLKWNESEYGNITSIRLPIERIWYPDVYAYNSASEAFDTLHYGTKAVIKSNGSIVYIPPGITHTTCSIDHTNYPWDEQKCELKFGSWTHDGGEVDLQLHSSLGGDISSFIPNPEWALIGVPGKRTALYYACCPDPYIDITFTIHIKRRGDSIYSQLQGWNYIIWATVLLGFFHPPNSALKILFCAGSMALSFWLLSTLTFLARSDEPPKIYHYFVIQTWLNLVALGLNVFVVFVYQRSGKCFGWINGFISYINRFQVLKTVCPSSGNMNHDDIGNCDTIPIDESRIHEGETSDWKHFARILDRMFTIIFATIVIFLNLVLF